MYKDIFWLWQTI